MNKQRHVTAKLLTCSAAASPDTSRGITIRLYLGLRLRVTELLIDTIDRSHATNSQLGVD